MVSKHKVRTIWLLERKYVDPYFSPKNTFLKRKLQLYHLIGI